MVENAPKLPALMTWLGLIVGVGSNEPVIAPVMVAFGVCPTWRTVQLAPKSKVQVALFPYVKLKLAKL